jgi:hypothetical protein
MSEPKFTKGPWELWTSCSWRRFCTPDGTPVVTPIVHHADRHPDLIVSEADAHLIASAPELYAALDACLDLIHNVGESHTVLFDQVVSALAKARGEVSDG